MPWNNDVRTENPVKQHYESHEKINKTINPILCANIDQTWKHEFVKFGYNHFCCFSIRKVGKKFDANGNFCIWL